MSLLTENCDNKVVILYIYYYKWQNDNHNVGRVWSSTIYRRYIKSTATCITYSTDYYQRLTLESWVTNLEQTPLNRSQQLPAPYKRLIDGIKQN